MVASLESRKSPGLASAEGFKAARLQTPSIASRVAAELREQLADGTLIPGTRLTEGPIAEALGVSRNTVREAFAELAAERLVVRHPNRGVFVSELGVDDIRDVYKVRRAIEVYAASMGGSADAIELVRKAVEEAKAALAAEDEDAVGTANQHFHRAVVALADSPRLNITMDHVLAEMRLFFHAAYLREKFYSPYVGDNERLCEALERQEFAEAGRLMADYLDRSERHLLDIFSAG